MAAELSKTVLITGCSSGIGRVAAAELAGAGWHVFAGVREEVDAAPLAASAGVVTAVELEITDPDSIAAALAQVSAATGGRLGALVNNAGIGVGGALETVPLDDLREILEVNVVGQIAVTRAFLPMLRATRGRVLIVGSVGGRVALPFAGPYHASKYALEALADSLRAELAPQGVSVGLVEPGPIETPIWSKAREGVAAQRAALEGDARELYDERLAGFEEQLRSAEEKGEKPAKVAAKIASALDGSTGSRFPVGRGVRTLIGLRELLPDRVFDRIARAIS
jgi:NAD(P)-dependent dehydrogenase (short-subunit alcohol dehydrogenase family)